MNFRPTWIRALVPVSVLAITLGGGCGSTDDSTFGNGNGNSPFKGGGDGGAFGEGGVDGEPQSYADLQACASTNANGALTPINLVVMYDRSYSMVSGGGSGGSGDVAAQKWDPAASAMKAFFTDPQSTGISAAITFFGLAGNNNNFTASCNHDYSQPDLALTPLPSAAFGPTIDAKKPNSNDIPNTPTRAALHGAVTQASKLKGTVPSAVLMVTDGYPQYCPNANGDDINVAAAEAKTGLDQGIKTYVVGVGTDLTNLQTIATQGGTQAILIAVGDPTKTQNDLRAALGRVSAELTSCKMPMPQPPAGQTLDKNAVNVSFSPAGGAPQLLDYKGDCSGPGWRYDNLDAPTQIELCPTTCDAVRTSAGGKVDIAFGCKTKIAIR